MFFIKQPPYKTINSVSDSTPMISRITVRLIAAVALLAVVCAAGAQSTSSMTPAKKQTKSKTRPPAKSHMESHVLARRILVFPPDTKGGITDQLTDVITDVEQSRLRLSGKYNSLYFLSSIPLIRRALNEQTLTPADVNPPYDNETKAKRLATLAGYDLVLLTSIGDYEYDPDKKQISLSVSARLIDFSTDKPVIRSVGDSIDKAAKDDMDISSANQAARDLTEKLMAEVLQAPGAAK